jgi:C1A family cysteine protease
MTTNKPKRRYAWIKDKPDSRDKLFAVQHGLTLPTHVDLTAHCSPVEDQGQLGSCTANAIAGAMEFLQNMQRAKVIPAARIVTSAGREMSLYADVSRLFIYYQERVLEGTVRQDAGAEIRDGVKACAKWGACTELLWPYDVSKFAKKPHAGCYLDAAKRKIKSYHRVVGLTALRQCLAEGYPVVFGFRVYEDFESEQVEATGILDMPKPNERELDGHAVLAVGYDDDARQVIVRNSWGATWGQKGYFRLPYGYIENASLSDDFWTIRKEASK